MHKLIDYVCDKLEDIERKVDKGAELSMSEIQYADTLAHLKKNLLKAEEMGYSGGNPYYYDDRSYARKRDARGQYSRRGYSLSNRDMADELRRMMNDAPDEHTRMEFQKFIDRIDAM